MSQVLSISQTDFPINLSRAKSHLIVEHSLDDTIIESYAKAATLLSQTYAGRLFSPATVIERIFCGGDMVLTYEASIITSVLVTFKDETTTTLTTTEHFKTRTEAEITRIIKGDDWPSGIIDNILVTYTTGYAADECPEDLKSAILLSLTDFYENRIDTPRTLRSRSEQILNLYRRWQFQ